ncbi:MAG: hypothetical protein ACJAW3_000098 [Lentimonas sp.]|jgi:hypothetical protein
MAPEQLKLEFGSLDFCSSNNGSFNPSFILGEEILLSTDEEVLVAAMSCCASCSVSAESDEFTAFFLHFTVRGVIGIGGLAIIFTGKISSSSEFYLF